MDKVADEQLDGSGRFQLVEVEPAALELGPEAQKLAYFEVDLLQVDDGAPFLAETYIRRARVMTPPSQGCPAPVLRTTN